LLESFLGDDGQAHVEDRDPARGLTLEGAVVRVPVEGYRGTSVVEGCPRRLVPRKAWISGGSPSTVARMGA
jgi:hypothetical protein